MKTALALGALAALCQSALALRDGTYTIGSAALPNNQVLSDGGEANRPLEFSIKSGHPFQSWFFTTRGSERDFVIENHSGGYIECGTEPGTTCVSGDDEQVYTVEQVSVNRYELVSKNTGYFLRAVDGGLQLAEYNNNPDEQFILAPI